MVCAPDRCKTGPAIADIVASQGHDSERCLILRVLVGDCWTASMPQHSGQHVAVEGEEVLQQSPQQGCTFAQQLAPLISCGSWLVLWIQGAKVTLFRINVDERWICRPTCLSLLVQSSYRTTCCSQSVWLGMKCTGRSCWEIFECNNILNSVLAYNMNAIESYSARTALSRPLARVAASCKQHSSSI